MKLIKGPQGYQGTTPRMTSERETTTTELVEISKSLTYKLLLKVNVQRNEELLGSYGPIGECRRPIDSLRAYLNYSNALAKELRE